jgi:hypothetical protein
MSLLLGAMLTRRTIGKARHATKQHNGLSPSPYKRLDIVVEGKLDGNRAQTHFVSL